MATDPMDELEAIARRALARAGRYGRTGTDRRRHAVQTLITARPRLSAPVALRLVKRVEGQVPGWGPALKRTA